MTWSVFSVSGDPLRAAMELIDDTVSAFRNRGHSRRHALDQAALKLGITPRRAKALLYGESFAMPVEEFKSIRAKYLTHLDEEADHLAVRSAASRARRRQMELDL